MGVETWLARFKPWQVVTAAVALIGATLGGALVLNPPGGYDDAGRDCRSLVEGRLKAPGSADFGTQSVTEAGDAAYISGSVDSENGFGATVRSDYRCQVDGDVVTLIALSQR